MAYAGAVPGVLGATIRDAANLPEHLPNGIRIDPWTEALPGALLFVVPGVARYLVQDGTTISVEPLPDADRNSVELFLHGSARGSLIHQRSELPLTAATVVSPRGTGVALCSHSGMGKSTLAADLCRRGWSLLADDITRITWTRGRAMAWPSHDSLKLWRDACKRLGIDEETLPRARAGLAKFHVKMPAASAPTVLRVAICLQRDKELTLKDVPTQSKIADLSEYVFRPSQTATLVRKADRDQIVQQVAQSCRIMTLTGCREFVSTALAERIIRVIP